MTGLPLFQLNILIKHLDQLEKNFLKPHFISPIVKILLYPALFSHGKAQQKLRSLKTLPSVKIKLLITYEILKKYEVLYPVMIPKCINTFLPARKCLMASCFCLP